jgi:uncharacterized protein YceK
LVAFGLSLGLGCAAIGTRDGRQERAPFSGVRGNAYYLANPQQADKPGIQWMNLLDAPFSLAADTLMLPFDLAAPKKSATNSIPPASNPR